MATVLKFGYFPPSNPPHTPLERGANPSRLFDSVEKIEAYLQKYGPFTVLSSNGPHCYLDAPKQSGNGRYYWPLGSRRIENPSLRLIEVVGAGNIGDGKESESVVSYKVFSGEDEEAYLGTDDKVYMMSGRRFLASLADHNPDYQKLWNDKVVVLCGATQENRDEVKQIGQKFFDQFYEETLNAITAKERLVNLHSTLPRQFRRTIESWWHGVGIGDLSKVDENNYRWQG